MFALSEQHISYWTLVEGFSETSRQNDSAYLFGAIFGLFIFI